MAKKINSLDYVKAYEELKALQQAYGSHYQMSIEVLQAKIKREFHLLRKPSEPIRPSSPLLPSIKDLRIPYGLFQWLFAFIKVGLVLPILAAQLFKNFIIRVVVFVLLGSIFYLFIPSLIIGGLMSVPIVGFAPSVGTSMTLVMFTTFLRAGINLFILSAIILAIVMVFKYLYLLQSTKIRQARYDSTVQHYSLLLESYPERLKAWELELTLLNNLIDQERDELMIRSAHCRELLSEIPLAYQTDDLMDFLKFNSKTRFNSIAELVNLLEQRQQELDLQAIEEEKEKLRIKQEEKEAQASQEKVEAEVVDESATDEPSTISEDETQTKHVEGESTLDKDDESTEAETIDNPTNDEPSMTSEDASSTDVNNDNSTQNTEDTNKEETKPKKGKA